MDTEFIEFHDLPSEDTPLCAREVNRMQKLIKAAIRAAVKEAVEKSKKTGYPGLIIPFDSLTIPSDMKALRCDGSAVSRTEYAELFAVIGTSNGEGDGSTTFNLPNIRGRNIVGYDENDEDFNVIGKTGGSKEQQLTIANIPKHDHPTGTENANYTVQKWNTSGGKDPSSAGNGSWEATVNSRTGPTGEGKAFNIMDPHMVLNYVIFY